MIYLVYYGTLHVTYSLCKYSVIRGSLQCKSGCSSNTKKAKTFFFRVAALMAASLSNDDTTDASASAPKVEDEDLDVFVKELMENSKCDSRKSNV